MKSRYLEEDVERAWGAGEGRDSPGRSRATPPVLGLDPTFVGCLRSSEWPAPSEARHDLALRCYTARLLGAEPALVLHGGGNTSVKTRGRTILEEDVEVLFVKASGFDLANIGSDGHMALDLRRAQGLAVLPAGDDDLLAAALAALKLDPRSPAPSIEAPVHALLPPKFIDHTHAEAILALSNRAEGERVVREALGEHVIVLPYVEPGIELARATLAAFQEQPDARGMVWLHHGLLTWGETARESYERTIELVTRAELYLEQERRRAAPPARTFTRQELPASWLATLRGALAPDTGNPDLPRRRLVLRALDDEATLAALAMPGARAQLATPPLTTDHLVRLGQRPLWLEAEKPRELSSEAIRAALARWEESHDEPFPGLVLVPGFGAVAVGANAARANVARDLAAQNLRVKAAMLEAGVAYQPLAPELLHAMHTRPLQTAKVARDARPLEGTIALVTGAAGAIGSGICRGLLENGALVAATDLAGEALDRLRAELDDDFPGHVLVTPLDVTDPASVAAAFNAVCREWGGVDLVIPNAGIAHVGALDALDLEAFRRLERVNVEGTLNVLAEAARLFRAQDLGGDVVLVSTKNVFAPGAGFGAYSATKAAAHQLARIASLELAPLGVRVNMVAPDAVFGDGSHRSGLWQEVGPSRMKARGLDEQGLEDYYRERNLLKTRVTAKHVAEAVLFFAMRKTPTTGATLPVDGGLPDATPR